MLTHPRIFSPPSPREPVVEELSRLRSRDNCLLVGPAGRHWAIFTQLCNTADAKGNLAQDAWLAAIAIEHNATFVTLDGDFARFRELSWERP